MSRPGSGFDGGVTTPVPHLTHPPTVLLVHESMFGNTGRVAAAVAEGLTAAGLRVEVLRAADTAGEATVDADLLVLGAPTHAFSLPRPATRAEASRKGAAAPPTARGVREWLSSARPRAAGVPCAAFDTRVTRLRSLPRSAAGRALRLASSRGFTTLLRPEAFFVEDVAGPLVPGELDRAHAYGTRLGESLLAELHGEHWRHAATAR